jgi:anti-sigma regulatory factor (Ser/Thr protein kinase)
MARLVGARSGYAARVETTNRPGGRCVVNGEGLRLQLDGDPRAPRTARRAIAEWLNALGCSSERRHGLLLVVSELVTNAVVHARSAPEVVATHRARRVRVEVYDNDVNPPVVRDPSTLDGGGGFGLAMVAALSVRWGWEPTATGKRVWAEAPC